MFLRVCIKIYVTLFISIKRILPKKEKYFISNLFPINIEAFVFLLRRVRDVLVFYLLLTKLFFFYMLLHILQCTVRGVHFVHSVRTILVLLGKAIKKK